MFPEALVRLMTINGAEALNMLQSGAGRLEPGSPADFCVLPPRPHLLRPRESGPDTLPMRASRIFTPSHTLPYIC